MKLTKRNLLKLADKLKLVQARGGKFAKIDFSPMAKKVLYGR